MKLRTTTYLRFLCAISLVGTGAGAAPVPSSVSPASKLASGAVARIETTLFAYSAESPWKPSSVHKSGGTGFILPGNLLLTNAHVVSRANTIRVQRPNQRTDYLATVRVIAHDCDLAILDVADPEFFRDAVPLEVGPLPALNSPVVVIGFPIGGDRVSITRGVVSRIGMDRYAHSRVDWHRVIQVDAAINPGNSGGPAIQDGRVIGVAFQVYRQGQNLGYLIPPEVVRRFLADAEDGRYDGYIDLGTLDLETTSAALRDALGMTGAGLLPPETGVFVYRIMPGSSAEGHIQVGDVLLSVNGHRLSHKGDVEVDGSQFNYSELVDNLMPGVPIRAEVFRGGRRVDLSFPARRSGILDYQRPNYNARPPYYLAAGLLFQPLDADLRDTYARAWTSLGRAEIFYRYDYHFLRSLNKEVKRDVILTRRLADSANRYSEEYLHRVVLSVNGQPVDDYASFVASLDAAIKGTEVIVLRFRGEPRPLVLRPHEVRAANDRVRLRYGIREDRRMPVAVGGFP